MARLSNAQGMLFVEFFTEEVKLDGPPVTTLKGWFGAQQSGQAKALIIDTINGHRGVVTHTVDDAVISSFPTARAAVDAALDLQHRLAATRTPQSLSIVRARAGISYGPVRVMAGKVTGDAMTAAGMLLEKCAPDQVLVDQSVVDAVGQVEDPKFEPRGKVGEISSYAVISANAPKPVQLAAPTVPVDPKRAPPPPPAAPAPAKVSVVLKYAGVEQRFDPSAGVVLIGRGHENQVIVPLKHVSRKHAKIIWHEGVTPCVVNLSPNGSCVRPKGSNQEQSFTEQVRLEGAGDLALCASFRQVSSPDEIVSFRLVTA